MKTVVFRVCAPVVTWRNTPQMDVVYTETMPTKSAVIGMICSAMGADRTDDHITEKVNHGVMTVRLDKTGIRINELKSQKQTIAANGNKGKTILAHQEIMSDVCNVIALQYTDEDFSQKVVDALKKPKRFMYFGSKSCPANSIHMEPHLTDETSEEAARNADWCPLVSHRPSNTGAEIDIVTTSSWDDPYQIPVHDERRSFRDLTDPRIPRFTAGSRPTRRDTLLVSEIE